MRRVASVSVMLASAFLAGCAGGTPDCGDMDTLEVIDSAIEMEVEKYASQTQRGTAEEFLGILDTYEIEPPRVLRRLQLLRRWSYEQVEQVFP